MMIWWEEEDGRPPTSVWFEWWGNFFQQVAAVLVKPIRVLWPLGLVALVLWIVSEAAEERRFERSWAGPRRRLRSSASPCSA